MFAEGEHQAGESVAESACMIDKVSGKDTGKVTL